MIITQNIENHIISELNRAEVSIDIAVAWITSQRIIDKIKEKKEQRVIIRILCWKDEDGQHRNRKLKSALGKRVRDEFEIYEVERMHFKVCIIDKKRVIKGSYNWTESAKSNEEYIEICDFDRSAEPLQRRFDELREGIIREFSNKKFKEEVLVAVKQDVSQEFRAKIDKYIGELAERNRAVMTDIDKRIIEQKDSLELFENRIKVIRKLPYITMWLMFFSICIIAGLSYFSIHWYKQSVKTKQEIREDILKEFDNQNLKLYHMDDYKELEETKHILDEWISKNPKDSRKFIDYRIKMKNP